MVGFWYDFSRKKCEGHRSKDLGESSPEVLETAERECRREGESRSELVRRALQGLIDRTREELQLAAYVAGYIAEPETDDEAHAVSEAAQPILEGSDWD